MTHFILLILSIGVPGDKIPVNAPAAIHLTRSHCEQLRDELQDAGTLNGMPFVVLNGRAITFSKEQTVCRMERT